MTFVEAIEKIKVLPIEPRYGNVILKDSWEMKKAVQYVPRGKNGLLVMFNITYFELNPGYFFKEKSTFKVLKPSDLTPDELFSDDWRVSLGRDIFGVYRKENQIV